MKNINTVFMVTLIIVSTFVLAFNIQPVKAEGAIYIRADGSIDPPDAPISTVDNVTYTLASNITSGGDGIVVERDNIVVDGAGYTVQGTGAYASKGLYLSERNNVTIKNVKIELFFWSIRLYGTSNSSIFGNSLAKNEVGILIDDFSDYNNIIGNNITNNAFGIVPYCTFAYSSSNHNRISGNNVTNNDYGIYIVNSSNSTICHNNFLNNTLQAWLSVNSYNNIWDDGYPFGGNYWSGYTDVDSFKGQHQNETGSDGVWDHPYVIDESDQDRYPLTKPLGRPAGDVDSDCDVDIFDIVRMAGGYDANYPDSRYDRLCDMDLDGDIDIFDIVIAAGNYGKSW